MDVNYLYFRQQVSQFNADNAGCTAARQAHQVMANAYLTRIASAKTARRLAKPA